MKTIAIQMMESLKQILTGNIWSLDTELHVLNWMSYALMVHSAAVFAIMSFFSEAPYGRYASSAWGPPVDARIAWFCQELPSLIVPLILWYFDSHQSMNLAGKMVLGGFIVHYMHRTLVYPWLIRSGQPFPLAVPLMVFSFCTYNGFLQTRYILGHAYYPESWVTSPQFIFGSLLFVFGMAVNIHSDYILRTLRRPGETGYKIPRGGMFNYVSGANFLGEIIEWAGFAVAGWSPPSAAFAISTVCSIGTRAVHHHRWYMKKFDDYPKNRKALIPFIF